MFCKSCIFCNDTTVLFIWWFFRRSQWLSTYDLLEQILNWSTCLSMRQRRQWQRYYAKPSDYMSYGNNSSRGKHRNDFRQLYMQNRRRKQLYSAIFHTTARHEASTQRACSHIDNVDVLYADIIRRSNHRHPPVKLCRLDRTGRPVQACSFWSQFDHGRARSDLAMIYCPSELW